MTGLVTFTDDELAALADMVSDWIGEGFTTPPYTNAQYGIFEKLGIQQDDFHAGYDIKRPPAATGKYQP